MASKNTTGKTTRKKNTSPTTDRKTYTLEMIGKALMEAAIGPRNRLKPIENRRRKIKPYEGKLKPQK